MHIHPPSAHLPAIAEAFMQAAVRATTPEWHWPDALFREHLPGLVDDATSMTLRDPTRMM